MSPCEHDSRPLLAGPAQLLVPEHTRDAFFQLFCDLRTNSPKDRSSQAQHCFPKLWSLQQLTELGLRSSCCTMTS